MSAFCKGREKKRRKKRKREREEEEEEEEEEEGEGEKKAEVIPRLTRALVICQGASVFARRWNQLL